MRLIWIRCQNSSDLELGKTANSTQLLPRVKRSRKKNNILICLRVQVQTFKLRLNFPLNTDAWGSRTGLQAWGCRVPLLFLEGEILTISWWYSSWPVNLSVFCHCMTALVQLSLPAAGRGSCPTGIIIVLIKLEKRQWDRCKLSLGAFIPSGSVWTIVPSFVLLGLCTRGALEAARSKRQAETYNGLKLGRHCQR